MRCNSFDNLPEKTSLPLSFKKALRKLFVVAGGLAVASLFGLGNKKAVKARRKAA